MPVSMLTRMHNIITPKVMGVAKNIDINEKLYFFKILKIIVVTPTENRTEKK